MISDLFEPAGITRVAEITGLDVVGIPVFTAVRPNARSLSVSQGKGVDPESARISAAMEALESWAGEHFRPATMIGRADELVAAGIEVTAVDELPRAPEGGLPSATALSWCRGIGLVSERELAVPFDLVHIDWTLPAGYGGLLFARDSNGLASGATMIDASAHALCELIERDAAALFRLGRRGVRCDSSSITDMAGAAAAELLERYTQAGVRVGVWDLTGDTGLPVILARVIDAEENPFRPLPAAEGLGAHPDPEVALNRALTEAAQSRLVNVAGARDSLLSGDYHRALDLEATRAIRAELSAPAQLAWNESPAHQVDAADSLREIAQRVAKITGHEPVKVDLTPTGWPVAVARVVAPGLEGAGDAFGSASRPGRRARGVRR